MAQTFHRKLLAHNRDEYDKVTKSMEVWGGQAKVLHHGICVQAYPGQHKTASAYSFGCDVPPREHYGFVGKTTVVRELSWHVGMPGVQMRDSGKYACIPILWARR